MTQPLAAPAAPGSVRVRVAIRGAVQGVGFRPFIFRLAKAHGLRGWVCNSPQGVVIEAEGAAEELARFVLKIEPERPAHSYIQSLETTYLDPAGYQEFEIHPSEHTGVASALVMPDIATCPECLREILDPGNRRFGYPFTNCTHCGPRFSIIEALPYDRPNTAMKGFPMCARCLAEYEDPGDRRFHAQPNACPECGPQVALWDLTGAALSDGPAAIEAGAQALREGAVLAVKGLGGFHLWVDARNEAAVVRLRSRKHREQKPLALMVATLASAQRLCEVSKLEARLLASPEAPIVLLRRRDWETPPGSQAPVADAVAPGNPFLGVMLPCMPLQHLLLKAIGFPVVATSGNLSDEPICTDEREALGRLGGIADLFLVHNRPIVRHVDDSIARIALGRELVLRRARGYAPLPVWLPTPLPPVLAVGAHLKNTVALARGQEVFLSQHIGDLEGAPAFEAFERVTTDLQRLLEVRPRVVAMDAHPDYLSSRYARRQSGPVVTVQHHYAHVLACMAENQLAPPILGVSWDGTGLGPDGTVWGGEFLRVDAAAYQRVGYWRTFRLPGGDAAVREPRRSALGLLHELGQAAVPIPEDLPSFQAFTAPERRVLDQMLASGLNSPMTSSVGRLFDAVASMVGLCQRARFEGQAAMELEFAALGVECDAAYPISWLDGEPPALDWAPMVRAILEDQRAGVKVGLISSRFHHALVEGILAVARRMNEPSVVLTGGCFQNMYLLQRAVPRLRAEGFSPYWHQRVPPNDGGVALGQAVAAARARTS